jgi:hypothetical protein
VGKRVSDDFSSANNFHLLLLLWLPLSVFWFFLSSFRHPSRETNPSCTWNKDEEQWSVLRNASMHCPYNKDFFETPTHRVFILFYGLLGLGFTAALIAYHNQPRNLKRATIWLHVLITTVIRGLSSFSGFTTLHNWSSLIWNSNSEGKIVWLWPLVENGCWSWTYLSFYEDYYFHDDTRTVHDRAGQPIWTFTYEKTGDEAKDDTYNPYSPIFLPWRDIAVRLSYVHLIDNTIHAIWFRYFIT